MTNLRILHISDSHGQFWEPHGRYDLVVHSGDIFPNITRGNREVEKRYQLEWLRTNGEGFRRWACGAPFVFCLGNHDFIDSQLLEHELENMGVDAVDVTDRDREFPDGMRIRGFPWVPRIDGEWNYEAYEQDIANKLAKWPATLPDVLVAHGPMAGVLDFTFDRKPLGSTAMANFLTQASHEGKRMPMAYLHGHMHESFGVRSELGMVVSNAATTMNLVEVDG